MHLSEYIKIHGASHVYDHQGESMDATQEAEGLAKLQKTLLLIYPMSEFGALPEM